MSKSKMTYEEYGDAVRRRITQIASNGDTSSSAAQEALSDLDRDGGPPYVKQPFDQGYSVEDAVRSILLTTDAAAGPDGENEDWAIEQQDRLRLKYMPEHERAEFLRAKAEHLARLKPPKPQKPDERYTLRYTLWRVKVRDGGDMRERSLTVGVWGQCTNMMHVVARVVEQGLAPNSVRELRVEYVGDSLDDDLPPGMMLFGPLDPKASRELNKTLDDLPITIWSGP